MKKYLHQYLFMNIYTSFVFNNSKLKTTQMSVKQWTDKLEYVYSRMCCVLLLSCVWLFMTPWTTKRQAPLSSTVFQSLLRFMSIESVMVSNHLNPLLPPFSCCLQSFPASGSFPGSWLTASGGQSIRASVSLSVLPLNIQGWFPLGLTGLISLKPKGFCASSL